MHRASDENRSSNVAAKQALRRGGRCPKTPNVWIMWYAPQDRDTKASESLLLLFSYAASSRQLILNLLTEVAKDKGHTPPLTIPPTP